jgi:hypothetical protein
MRGQPRLEPLHKSRHVNRTGRRLEVPGARCCGPLKPIQPRSNVRLRHVQPAGRSRLKIDAPLMRQAQQRHDIRRRRRG